LFFASSNSAGGSGGCSGVGSTGLISCTVPYGPAAPIKLLRRDVARVRP